MSSTPCLSLTGDDDKVLNALCMCSLFTLTTGNNGPYIGPEAGYTRNLISFNQCKDVEFTFVLSRDWAVFP